MDTDTHNVNDQSTLFFHSMHVSEVVHVDTARKLCQHTKLQTSSHNVKHEISYKTEELIQCFAEDIGEKD